MTVPLWKFDRVTQRGSGSQLRLDAISVEIPRGVTAVIGPSGAGKTSLLNLLVGFESPDSGTITKDLPEDGNRLPLFWVPPDDGLWPHLTVGEHLDAVSVGNGLCTVPRASLGPASNVAPGTAQRPFPTAGLLADFDLQDKIDARPDQLSQGERARLAVARALASDAAVQVMDEPLTHVDPCGWAGTGRFCGTDWQIAARRALFSRHIRRKSPCGKRNGSCASIKAS